MKTLRIPQSDTNADWIKPVRNIRAHRPGGHDHDQSKHGRKVPAGGKPKEREWTRDDGTKIALSPSDEEIEKKAQWAHDALNGEIARWVTLDESSAKGRMMEVYTNLEESSRAGLSFQVEDAILEHTGGNEYVTAYRLMGENQESGDMGGASLSLRKLDRKGRGELVEFKVHHSEILDTSLLWPHSFLGNPNAFGHEQEMILKPDANPERVIGDNIRAHRPGGHDHDQSNHGRGGDKQEIEELDKYMSEMEQAVAEARKMKSAGAVDRLRKYTGRFADGNYKSKAIRMVEDRISSVGKQRDKIKQRLDAANREEPEQATSKPASDDWFDRFAKGLPPKETDNIRAHRPGGHDHDQSNHGRGNRADFIQDSLAKAKGKLKEKSDAFAERARSHGHDDEVAERLYDEYSRARKEVKHWEFQVRHPGAKELRWEEQDDYMADLEALNDGVPNHLEEGLFGGEMKDSGRRWKRGEMIEESENLGDKFEVDISGGVLFRGVTKQDWKRIRDQGFVDTDGRGVIVKEEGINLASGTRTSVAYIPHGTEGVVLAIDPKGLDLFMIGADDYIRAAGRIPIENVVKVSGPIGNDADMGQPYIPGTDDIRAAYNPDQPRDENGMWTDGARGGSVSTTDDSKRTSEARRLGEPARDGRGRGEGGSTEALEGTPKIKGATGPDRGVVEVAEKYARDNGIDLRRQSEYVRVDTERAERIAAAYEAMPHAPDDPEVREAYDNLIEQTEAQYEALSEAGYEFYFFDGAGDYGNSPYNAMRELRAEKRMGVYPTDTESFGEDSSAVMDNPLLRDTGLKWDGPNGKQPVTANDLFRAVHDAFGHAMEGSGFRARGEENAWQAHVRLFTGSAVGAITSETRGQNSWLNFGPHGDTNRTAKVEDTIFAEQKTGLMPEWTWTEGRAGDAPDDVGAAYNPDQPRDPGGEGGGQWIKAPSSGGTKGKVYRDSEEFGAAVADHWVNYGSRPGATAEEREREEIAEGWRRRHKENQVDENDPMQDMLDEAIVEAEKSPLYVEAQEKMGSDIIFLSNEGGKNGALGNRHGVVTVIEAGTIKSTYQGLGGDPILIGGKDIRSRIPISTEHARITPPGDRDLDMITERSNLPGLIHHEYGHRVDKFISGTEGRKKIMENFHNNDATKLSWYSSSYPTGQEWISELFTLANHPDYKTKDWPGYVNESIDLIKEEIRKL